MKNRETVLITLFSLALAVTGTTLWKEAAAQETTTKTTTEATALPDAPEPAQSNWRRVESLTREDMITVRARGGEKYRCVFDGSTNDELFCSSMGFAYNQFNWRFQRDEVEVVRRLHERRNMILTTVVFGAAGCGFAMATPTSNGAPAAISCAEGGLIGAGAGAFLALVSKPFVPGELIYRKRKGR